ncbi:polysaccharide deacetylase family protein [Psychrobacillus sp. FSL H8-0483]|uniref:polysaccharide deacetylase family protein n=1 Tax=Psychrobacillus sp. FSL H8-0483 TaxID=2921389 RepID=UPI00315B1E0D
MSISPRSRKRSHWIDILCIVAIILLSSLIVFLLLKSTSTKQQGIVASSKQSSEAKEKIKESNSVYPGIRIITETSNEKKAPYAIQYPQSNVQSFNEIVKTYTQKLKTLYLEETKYINETNKHNKGELNISFEVFQHSTGYYSFVIHSSMYTGGANGVSEKKIFRLHNQSGHMLTLEELIGKNERALVTLSEKVKKAVTMDKQIKPYIIQDQLEEKTAPKWGNFSNFALTKDSILFYYDEYEITTGSAGAPIVTIPLTEINDLVADAFKLPVVAVDSKPSTKVPAKEEQNVPKTTTEEACEVSPKDKVVSLTFDDGPNPDTTVKILETLKKYNAKATFFMLGSRVSFYPEIVQEMKAAGHELGNHTWNHPDLTKASSEKIALEINNTDNAVEKASGSKPTVFRPPYGAVNQTVRNQTALPVVLWDVDTMDWKYRDPNHLLQHVKQHVKNGSIILMHDIHASTAEGLDAVLAYLKGEGYSFVTISELNKLENRKRTISAS